MASSPEVPRPVSATPEAVPPPVPTTSAASAADARPALPSDPAALQAAIREHQDRLAGSIDELRARLTPQDIARRASGSARERARAAVLAEDGGLRVERVAAVAAAVVGVVLLVVVRSRRSR